MQDAGLFLSLAEIAGVFVGFGALIAVRSSGPSEPQEVAPMRAMVSLGLLTVVLALAPVTLVRYGLTAHQVWASSSGLALVGFIVIIAANARTPEYRENWAAELDRSRTRDRAAATLELVEGAVYVLYMVSLVLLPIVIVLGLRPDIESALYFTVVVLYLLGAGSILLSLVFGQRRAAGA